MNNSIKKTEEDNNMFDWWKKAMIDNYFNFNGRARRKEYWYSLLMNILIVMSLALVTSLISEFFIMLNIDDDELIDGMFGLFIAVFFLVVIIPSLAVSVRRLHDTDKSGWFLLITLIPLIGRLILLVFYIEDSKPQRNKWGASPKNIRQNTLLEEIGERNDD